jgi:hypothetical protein
MTKVGITLSFYEFFGWVNADSIREGLRQEMYGKLLTFIDSNNRFAIDRLYGSLSSTGMSASRVSKRRPR